MSNRKVEIRLTEEQYIALEALHQKKDGGASAAARRLVFVDGLSISDAARSVGITRQAVSNTVLRAQEKIVAIKDFMKNDPVDAQETPLVEP